AVRFGGRTADAEERLIELDGVLPKMLLEAMQTEAQRHRAVPEPRRRLDLVVGDVAQLSQDADVDLREGVADALDVRGRDRRRRLVPVGGDRRAECVPLLVARLARVPRESALETQARDREEA